MGLFVFYMPARRTKAAREEANGCAIEVAVEGSDWTIRSENGWQSRRLGEMIAHR
jgi:hypothetical protein